VEEMVAKAIAGRRDRTFLVSKVLPVNASQVGTKASCEASLRRLGTDRLDCYLLHWREAIPLEDTISAFEDLKSEGKILSWGVSNFDIADLEDAIAIAGPGKIACNQILYNLQERGSEHRVIPWCCNRGIAVTAYSTFSDSRFPSADNDQGRVLREVAAELDVTTHQVAMAFLIHVFPVFAIPRSTRVEHTEQNAAVIDISLSPSQIDRIDRAFPVGPVPAVLPAI
jgi:diketogulonate reductase-like aldo/keto reductase